jgi:hypothetical protein
MSDDYDGPISRRLRTVLADYVTKYCVLKDINDAFGDARIRYEEDPFYTGESQRRKLIRGYYQGISWHDPADVQKFLRAMTPFLKEAERLYRLEIERRMSWDDSPPPEHQGHRLIDELQYLGYSWTGTIIVPSTPAARLADAKAFAEKFQLNHLSEHIKRIETSIDTDPAQAIGSAKELVETVAKTILTNRRITYGASDDLLHLGKAVFKALKQLPDDIPNAAKGADTIKKMLSNLASVIQGIAEMRGLYGTGHGKDGKAKGLQPRHARLVVGMATSLAVYWVDTDNETPPTLPIDNPW